MLNDSLKIDDKNTLFGYNIPVPDNQIQCDIIENSSTEQFTYNNKQSFILPSNHINSSTNHTNNINNNTTMNFNGQYSSLIQDSSPVFFTPKNINIVS